MKNFCLCSLLVFVATVANAATINYGSGVAGTIEGNTFNTFNVPTLVASAWQAPLGTSVWESIVSDTLSTTITNGTIVDFYIAVFLSSAPTSGTLGLLVDDAAEVRVNGNVIANNLADPLGSNCASTLPGCTIVANYDILADLNSGFNIIEFFVKQEGGQQYGFDAYGTITTKGDTVVDAPEPMASILAGSGLFALVFLARKLKRN